VPVLLVRHGEAAPPVAGDASRHLTLRGRGETQLVGQKLHALGHAPTMMVSSPLVRAVQTAEILACALGYDGVITVDAALEPDADPAVAARRIPGAAGLTVVVCHEPIVRGIAAILTGTATFRGFATSGAVLISEEKVLLELVP
jgi:phosphohistidine phosphatase